MPRKKKTPPPYFKFVNSFPIGTLVMTHHGNTQWRVTGFNELTGFYNLVSPKGTMISCCHSRLKRVPDLRKLLVETPELQQGQCVTRVLATKKTTEIKAGDYVRFKKGKEIWLVMRVEPVTKKASLHRTGRNRNESRRVATDKLIKTLPPPLPEKSNLLEQQVIETPNGIEKETGKSMAQSPKFQKGQYVTRVVESNSGRVDGYIWKVDWYNPVANNIRLLPTDDSREPWVGWAGPEGTYFRVVNFEERKDAYVKSPFPDAPLSGFVNGEVTAGDLVNSPEYQDKIKKIVEYLDRDYEARQAEKIAKDAVDLVESKPSLGEMLKQPAQVMVDGLLVSADTLPYHLIPPVALRELCKRIRLGEEIKGKDAWNALSDNQQVLDSRKALAHRLGHLISHAYGLLEKIQAGIEWQEADLGEAAAVMWGGMYAICAIDRQRSPEKP